MTGNNDEVSPCWIKQWILALGGQAAETEGIIPAGCGTCRFLEVGVLRLLAPLVRLGLWPRQFLPAWTPATGISLAIIPTLPGAYA